LGLHTLKEDSNKPSPNQKETIRMKLKLKSNRVNVLLHQIAANSMLVAVLGLFILLVLVQTGHAWTGDVPLAVDINPDPDIFETTLTAEKTDNVDLGGGNSAEFMYTFNGSSPGPEINVKVGDRVIVHLHNNIPDELLTVHWHGIELNNTSDGTPVTQNPISTGETYEYNFIVTRPGVFWYHPHMTATDQVFRGLYGPFIVTDAAEEKLENLGVLPARVKTLVLGDTTLCKQVRLTQSIDSYEPIIDECLAHPGHPNLIPKIQPSSTGENDEFGNTVKEGQIILSNGRSVQSGDELEVPVGEGLRLKIINATNTRYFRLATSNGDPLYRVGGEGGLLDNVRLEGGMLGPVATGYTSGEILLAPADRTDVVIVPSGSAGDLITISTTVYYRGRPTDSAQKLGPVVNIRLVAGAGTYSIGVDDALLTNSSCVNAGQCIPVEDLGLIPASAINNLIDPTNLPGAPPGMDDPVISFDQGARINDVSGFFERLYPGGFTAIPHIGSTRYAYIGDTLELSVTNTTGADHPFHLHGFSHQPISLSDGTNTYNFPYNEFIDNFNVKHGYTYKFRVRLDDRPEFGAFSGETGGAAGRWLFHCHIFFHGALGMMSELVAVPRTPLDVFMVADQTGSFLDDLAAFKDQAAGIVNTLSNLYPDLQMGLATFQDFPIDPFGLPTDLPYTRELQLSDDFPTLLTTINGLSISDGSGGIDSPESQLYALRQAAIGPPSDFADFRGTNLSGEAVAKIFILWTDAPFHVPGDGGGTYPGPSFDDTVAAIASLDPPIVVGLTPLPPGNPDRADLEAMALATGGVAPHGGIDCDGDSIIDVEEGEPLVCSTSADGSSIGETFVRVVRAGIEASTCGGLTPTLVGTEASETIIGTAGPDVINALGGDDTVFGLGGDDVICGGNGRDTLYGGKPGMTTGAGNDILIGGADNDTLVGGDGDDTLVGRDGDDKLLGRGGNDTLKGGTGNDTLVGDEGDDTLIGEEGDDTLTGGDGNDTMNGNDGDDTMNGGYGDDTMNGGDGNDTINGSYGDDTMDGGAGVDTCVGSKGFDTAVKCETKASIP
jgi:FtsP/CotA-like multicopper oxidase with cupredoxin domain